MGKIINISSFKKNIGILVLKDIFCIFWLKYAFIGFLSGFSFILQMFGVAILLSSFNNKLKLPLDLQDLFVKFFNDYQMVIFSFVLLSVSATLMFAGRKLIVGMMVDYEGICANQLFSVVTKSCSQNLKDSEILRLLSKDCRFGGRVVQEISSVVMPMGIALVALPLLLYMNYYATFALFLVAIITLIPYFFIASKAREMSYSFENSASIDGQYKKQAIAHFRKVKNIDASISFPHSDFKDLYKQRLIMPHYGILIGGMQFAFCLGIMGLWFVITRESGANIASIVFYGYIASFTLNQLRPMAKVFANFHVFLAYFQRAFVIIKGISPTQIEHTVIDDESVAPASEEEF
jgi:hypothetical protein